MSCNSDQAALSRAARHAFDFLESLPRRHAAPTATLDQLRGRLGRDLPNRGVDPVQVIDDLVADVDGGLQGTQSGRFFAWVMGGGHPAAMAADWLATVWDQNAGIYACSPAAAVVEEVAAEWLTELFELPAGTSVGFVTGTQMGHATCLAAARHALLRDRGWDVERKGLCGAPAIRILANADRHASLDRAARLLGLGTDCIVDLPLSADGQVTPDGLAAALSASDQPTIVALTAGELNLGVFDPFAELAPMARAAGAWTHVDAAFGLWAKASLKLKPLVAGLELCDSWTTDCHKMLNVPYDSGVAFVRDAEAHRGALTLSTSYLPDGGAARDQIDWNPEFSRRARGFAVYAALRELGREGLAALIERCCANAQAVAAGVGALPGAEAGPIPKLNQALVRFRAEGADDAAADDRRTDAVIEAINASGEGVFGGVSWRGRRWMRISSCNRRTTDADVARVVEAARRALETT